LGSFGFDEVQTHWPAAEQLDDTDTEAARADDGDEHVRLREPTYAPVESLYRGGSPRYDVSLLVILLDHNLATVNNALDTH
jgi:hypothetical protein